MISIKTDSSSKKALMGIEKLHTYAPRAIRQCLYKVGTILKPTASQGILKSTKTGETYKYKGRKYRASSGGEYPANVSGKNRRSIGFNVSGNKRLYFGAGEEHSRYLVEGTKNMRKRDFLLKAINDSEQKTKRAVRTELDRQLKRAMK